MSMIEDLAEAAASTRCQELLERGRRSLAGGDSSTMRVLPYQIPLVAQRGEGSRIWDADGKEYVRPKHGLRSAHLRPPAQACDRRGRSASPRPGQHPGVSHRNQHPCGGEDQVAFSQHGAYAFRQFGQRSGQLGCPVRLAPRQAGRRSSSSKGIITGPATPCSTAIMPHCPSCRTATSGRCGQARTA